MIERTKQAGCQLEPFRHTSKTVSRAALHFLPKDAIPWSNFLQAESTYRLKNSFCYLRIEPGVGVVYYDVKLILHFIRGIFINVLLMQSETQCHEIFQKGCHFTLNLTTVINSL